MAYQPQPGWTTVNWRDVTERSEMARRAQVARSPEWSLDDLVAELRAISDSGIFEDDLTLVRLRMP